MNINSKQLLLKTTCGLLLASLVFGAGNLAFTQQPIQSNVKKSLTIDLCVVSLIDDIDVPAEVEGKIDGVSIRRGQSVVEGELLAAIDEDTAIIRHQAAVSQLDAAKETANDDVSVRYAEKSHEVALADYETNQKLREKSAITEPELARFKLAEEQTSLQIEKSKHEMSIADKDVDVQEQAVKLALNELGKHKIHSTLSGVVAEVLKKKGEWVSAGETVMRISRMDRLQVQGLLSVKSISQHELRECDVIVRLKLVNDEVHEFEGVVAHIDPEQKAGGNYSVWAEVDNRQVNDNWLLLPFAEVSMEIVPR